MTPPDPATPSPLEALLKEVDRAVTDPRSFREDAFDWSAAAQSVRSDAAPRLAAIVRVLREAMTFYASGDRNAFRCESERMDPAKGTGPCCERVIDAGGIAADALRRADEIAGGIRGSVTPGSGQTGEAHETV